MVPRDIIRKALLTAQMPESKTVDRVEVQEIAFPAHQQSPEHLHPCPVVGLIVEGKIRLQVDGQAPQDLGAGDAFYEPANARILHFDALDGPAKFVAYYLLNNEDSDLIVIL